MGCLNVSMKFIDNGFLLPNSQFFFILSPASSYCKGPLLIWSPFSSYCSTQSFSRTMVSLDFPRWLGKICEHVLALIGEGLDASCQDEHCLHTNMGNNSIIHLYFYANLCAYTAKKASTCKGGKLTNRDHQSKVQENPCQHSFITLTDTCCHLEEEDFTLFVSS